MSEKKRTAKQLILMGIVVLCAVFLAFGMFLPWLNVYGVHNGEPVKNAYPIFNNTYTIMSNYNNTFPISGIRFTALLCAITCGFSAFLIIFGVVDVYQPEKGIKIFWSILTILSAVALAGLSMYYLDKINAYFTNETVFKVAFGFIAIPASTLVSGISLILYK